MASSKNCILVAFLLVAAAIVWMCMSKGSNERYDRIPIEAVTPKGLPSVLKDKQFFSGTSPSLRVERDYHQLIHDECGGNYQDYKCRQKAYLKALKNGTYDRADLICSRYDNDEDAYYRCLDGVYGQYMWMDRFSGTQPCKCPGLLGQGASTLDTCFCPTGRDLRDRRPTDNQHRLVEKVLYE